MLSPFLIEDLRSGHDLLNRTSMDGGAKLMLKFLHNEDNYRSFRLNYNLLKSMIIPIASPPASKASFCHFEIISGSRLVLPNATRLSIEVFLC